MQKETNGQFWGGWVGGWGSIRSKGFWELLCSPLWPGDPQQSQDPLPSLPQGQGKKDQYSEKPPPWLSPTVVCSRCHSQCLKSQLFMEAMGTELAFKMANWQYLKCQMFHFLLHRTLLLQINPVQSSYQDLCTSMVIAVPFTIAATSSK